MPGREIGTTPDQIYKVGDTNGPTVAQLLSLQTVGCFDAVTAHARAHASCNEHKIAVWILTDVDTDRRRYREA